MSSLQSTVKLLHVKSSRNVFGLAFDVMRYACSIQKVVAKQLVYVTLYVAMKILLRSLVL